MTKDSGALYRAAVRAGMTLIDVNFGHRLSAQERAAIRSLVRAGADVAASASLPKVNVSTLSFSDDDLRLVREAVGAAVIHAVKRA